MQLRATNKASCGMILSELVTVSANSSAQRKICKSNTHFEVSYACEQENIESSGHIEWQT
jgi:hypothetical protein